jgi:glycosyltransferase involved in cell wall biosynthesis
MIGSVPTHWGGGAKWRGGGIASHVQGLLSVLPANGVTVRLLADNTDASQPPPFPDLSPEVEFQAMARSPGDVFRLGVGRMVRLAWRMMSIPEVRTSAPPDQVVRFWGQTVNFDHFLDGPPADVLHIHRAFNRQFLCQQVVGVATPMVVTVHSVNALVRPNPAWIGRMIKANYRRAGSMIAVSNYVKEMIVGFGAQPERITVIPNGVDINLFSSRPPLEARASLGLPQEAFIVLFSGNLIPRKGVDVLIKAFSRIASLHPNARLVVIGVGDEREELVHLASELGMAEKIEFAGYKLFTEMPLWYQACDVFAMPSWAEGLSMSILEAMASGRPVITGRPEVGQHDAVVPEETGLLTDYGDVAQLAQALDRLVSSPEWVRRLGDNARRMAEQKFSWELIGRQTADVYRMALRLGRRQRNPV